MKVGELCQRLNVPYRHARYVLEEGILPRGVEESPGRGDHRDLTSAQAFWLGIVLMLKQNGIKALLAGKIADFVQEGVRSIGSNLSWDPGFNPFLGRFDTEHQWFVDIGDLSYVRMATDADPSYGGKLREFAWSALGKRQTVAGATPVVIIRLDISRLAQLLRG